MKFSKCVFVLFYFVIYIISQNPVHCKIFLPCFFMFFCEKYIDKCRKICYCNKGSPSPIYILESLQHFNALKHDLQARWTKSPHFPSVPYSIGSNQSGLGFRPSFVVLILSYFNIFVKYYFLFFKTFLLFNSQQDNAIMLETCENVLICLYNGCLYVKDIYIAIP